MYEKHHIKITLNFLTDFGATEQTVVMAMKSSNTTDANGKSPTMSIAMTVMNVGTSRV